MPNQAIELNVETNANFVEFTRVYKVASTGAIKTQPITLDVNSVVSARPSNRLGKADHRSTVTMIDGSSYELAETYSTVTAELAE